VGAWLTRQAPAALTSAVAGMVVLGGTLAGCGGTAASSRPSRPAVASSAPVPASPAPSKPTGSFPLPAAQPTGSCPFVSQRQVAAALGQPVRHVRGCVYSFAHLAGTLVVTTRKYSSEAMAAGCLHAQADGPGFRVEKIPGLGSEAEAVIMPPAEVVTAVVVRDAKLVAVVIFWRFAVRHPVMAATLLRDAAANFGKFTSAIQPVC
jgi:hypothetical protein